MSTEHQKYSIDNQCAAIADYARGRGLTIVRTYADRGKSGLNIARRGALKQLISDVQNGAADFGTVLVYDVSRWGRFQDNDESAYYEFICTKAGIAVRYCAEPFDNDGSLISAILKSMKRAMAAEYSRELSTKIFNAQLRGAKRGFKQGGTTPYGLRRLLVDDNGCPKEELKPGQQKALRSDRIMLVPGPADEVATVRRIFDLFVNERKSGTKIAAILNAAGKRNPAGQFWTHYQIYRIISNEIYIGNYIYNRRSAKLKGPRVRNPPEQWVRINGMVRPLVPVELFDAARRILEDRQLGDRELLDRLHKLWKEKGQLTAALINSAPGVPSANTYRSRFGGLTQAYKLIGYDDAKTVADPAIGNRTRMFVQHLIDEAAAHIRRAGGFAWPDAHRCLLIVNGETNLLFSVARYGHYWGKSWCWRSRLRRRSRVDFAIVAVMDENNQSIRDFYLLPQSEMDRANFWLTKRKADLLEPFRHDTLEFLAEFGAPKLAVKS